MTANPLILMVPRTRIELVRSYASRDFKSLASTNSATQALFRAILYRILNSCQHHSEDPQGNVKVGDKPLVLHDYRRIINWRNLNETYLSMNS